MPQNYMHQNPNAMHSTVGAKPLHQKCKINTQNLNKLTAMHFKEFTEERLRDSILLLQRLRWKSNRRRVEHLKPSKMPKIDAKSALSSYNRLIQFRRQPAEMIWLETMRSVILMISAYGAMQKRGCTLERLTLRNVMDQYRVAVNTTKRSADGTGVGVSYNYKDYAVGKAMAVPMDAVKIMQKHEDLRTHQDIMTIYTVMMNLSVFQNNYTYDQCWTLAKNLKYFRCEAKRVLTWKNRNPIRVYFIYSGEVNVVVGSEEESEGSSSPTKTITLGRGSCIGHTSKTSCCICATNCEFLTIEKIIYIKEGIHAVLAEEMEERFKFFRDWPPLENWSDNAIYDLSTLSYTDSYTSGTMILHHIKDEMLDLIWFVLKGKMDVVKVADQNACSKILEKEEGSNTLDQTMSRRVKMAKFLDSTLKKVQSKSDLDRDQACNNVFIRSFRLPTTSIKSLANYLEKEKLHDSKVETIEKPIYLKMRSLLPGECYGLDNIDEGKDSQQKTTNRFCLVSRDCIVIRVPCSQFLELIHILGIDRKALSKVVHSYYDDKKICKLMDAELKWREYKQKIVESQILWRPTQRKTRNFLTHVLSTEETMTNYNETNYLRPHKFIRPGSINIINPYYLIATNVNAKHKNARCLTEVLPILK